MDGTIEGAEDGTEMCGEVRHDAPLDHHWLSKVFIYKLN